ncbi:histidine kinase 2 [Coffea eugenioides]|uniref:histidine kinase 2 n=1 Tax=Coffea eugenioides TaxID=49369 RepID=UPI000F611F3B|nr:histidine kinase 2 [Coffea eugenioides]
MGLLSGSSLSLKLCRWVSVNMPLNRNLSGLKCSFFLHFGLKKASEALTGATHGWKLKRQLIFLWIVSVIVAFAMLLSSFSGKSWVVKTPPFNEEKVEILLKHFNVSKEQINSLASLFETEQVSSLTCNIQYGHQMSLSPIKNCAVKMISSMSDIEKWHDFVTENNKLDNLMCPVHDDNISQNLDLSVLKDGCSFISWCTSSASSDHECSVQLEVFKDMLSRWPLVRGTRYHCEWLLVDIIKICWWVLIGMVLSWKLRTLPEELWGNQKQHLVQQKPLDQRPKLLQKLRQPLTACSSKSAGKWRKKLLVIFVLAGIFGSIWLFLYLNEDITLRRKEMLASMCDERARMLQDQFNVSMNHVHALAILVSTFYHELEPLALDQKTFEEYTEKTAFERPLTSGVAYALRVLHLMRERFEEQQGWTIKKMETEDQTLSQDLVPENLDPSPVQEEYAPVIFTQKTVSHIVSIDMMSGKEDRENILRARASGKGVLTSPFKLLKSNHLGVVLTFAVYNTHLPPDATQMQRINATVGYLGASYDVPSLVEKLLHQLASKQTIIVNVYDSTNKSAPINMYGKDGMDTGLLHISNLDFGDPARKHEMHCRFKEKPPIPWTATTASVGVLVITLLLGHIFHAAINRIAKVEHDYQEMMVLKHRAEAADVAKSQFLATVSHEIRTPMNGVLGMLQMLMDTNLDENQWDYAKTAHESGKDLIALINEVLDQAKIESGRLELEAVRFNLRADLDKVLSLLAGKSLEKEIELAVYVSDEVPEVVIGDPGRFGQIITNLVGNSIKFTKDKDKGHIFVSVHLADEVNSFLDARDEVLRQSLILAQDGTNAPFNTLSGFPVVDRWKSWESFTKLSAKAEDAEKIKLLVTVEDTGEGIPFDAQGRIFMPFMQADSSTSRTHGGTGIGLSISKHLVDLMGGEIGFVSEPGTGSTFSFTVTFRKAENICMGMHWQQCDQAVSEFRGLKALVIDQKNIRAEVTRYHLKRLGMSVDIKSTVDSACSYISSCASTSASERLAMVLIDKDSWANEAYIAVSCVLKDLRSRGSMSNLGTISTSDILLLATSTNPAELAELKSIGVVNHVLTKPIRLSDLITCIQEVTGSGRDRQVARGKQPMLGNLLRDKQILVVDDHVVNRRVAEAALKKYGAIVTCVDNGKAALEQLDPPHQFHACFMDLQMPLMDGYEATRRIRDLEYKYNRQTNSCELSTQILSMVAQWHTPILAMTADVIQATNEECMKWGMDGYASKPFEEGQLYSAVARFFECADGKWV